MKQAREIKCSTSKIVPTAKSGPNIEEVSKVDTEKTEEPTTKRNDFLITSKKSEQFHLVNIDHMRNQRSPGKKPSDQTLKSAEPKRHNMDTRLICHTSFYGTKRPTKHITRCSNTKRRRIVSWILNKAKRGMEKNLKIMLNPEI